MSPTAIGAFVAGAIALLMAAIVIVGGGKLFSKPVRFICMFQGDINGLKVGAPVKFKGVQIGTVEQIRLRLLPSEGRERPGIRGFRLPVIIAIDQSLITQRGGSREALSQPGFEDLLQSGLRAQLNVESLLTGLLFVDLDVHPEAPVNLALIPGSGGLREIPTIPTTLEEVQAKALKALAKFEEIDFQALVTSITDAANSIKDLTSSPTLKATLDSLKVATANLDKTATSIRVAVDHANSKIDPVVASLQKSSDEANVTMKDTRATLAELQSTLEPDSPLSVHLNEALAQLTDTTRSVGELTDYLQRNPAALIRGKYVPEKDRSSR